MEYLDPTSNSSILRTSSAVGLDKIIKMLRVTVCMVLYITASRGQVLPYGSTPVPFSNSIPAVAPTIAPTVPPLGPNGFPFGPNPRQFLPAAYNNQYYNPTAGAAIPILTYSSDHVGDGSYSFSYSTADGKQAQESGYLKDAYIDNAGEPQGTQVVQGSYAYVAPDGTPIQVSYVADENGFRPSGVHIPADGKGLPPLPNVIDGRKDNKVVDPFNRFNPYNRYDPYNSRLDYNGRQFNRPYDPRYPYDPARYNPYNQVNPVNNLNPFNPYRPPVALYGKDVANKEEVKKTA